jgi:hypothetical protein
MYPSPTSPMALCSLVAKDVVKPVELDLVLEGKIVERAMEVAAFVFATCVSAKSRPGYYPGAGC